jgi:hypothetical protein
LEKEGQGGFFFSDFKSPLIPLFLRGKINKKLRMNGFILIDE